MASCGQRNPEHPGLSCELEEGNHPLCTGYDADAGVFRDWENPLYEKPKRQRGANQDVRETLRELAAKVEIAPTTLGREAPAEDETPARWTENQKAYVLKAIIAVAERLDEFTADDIWDELNGAVPLNNGMTPMLKLASKRGIADTTGKKVTTRRDSSGKGKSRTVWYSLIKAPQ